MQTEARRRLIPQFQAHLAQMREYLAPLESGEQRAFADRIDMTSAHIEGLRKGIAEYERLIGILERDLHQF